jgi:hypothetical protein
MIKKLISIGIICIFLILSFSAIPAVSEEVKEHSINKNHSAIIFGRIEDDDDPGDLIYLIDVIIIDFSKSPFITHITTDHYILDDENFIGILRPNFICGIIVYDSSA